MRYLGTSDRVGFVVFLLFFQQTYPNTRLTMVSLKRTWIPLVLIGFSMHACSAEKRVQRYSYLYEDNARPVQPTTTSPEPAEKPAPEEPRPAPRSTAHEQDKVIQTALSYRGTPYKYGGMSRKGMDCSGLVCTAYQAVGKELPHSSSALARVGRSVPRNKLEPGHLVFFSSNNGLNINHVGLVVEVKGKRVDFIHASTSKGVRIDSLEDPYWKKRFRRATAP